MAGATNPVRTPWAYMQTKDKFDRPVFGELLGAYIREKKRFNSQSFKPIFISFFPIIKHVSRHLSRRARCEICSKLPIRIRKTSEYLKLTIKLKLKISLTSFWPLYC